MIRVLRLLSVRHLLRQRLRTGLAVVSVAVGVAVGVGVFIAIDSVSASLDGFYREMAGPTPLRVAGAIHHGGIDGAVVEDVRATPGVKGAVPLVQTVTLVAAPGREPVPVLTLGADCSLREVVAGLACRDDVPWPTAVVGPAVVARHGRDAVVRTDAGDVPLGSAAVEPRLASINDGEIIVFPLARAQELFVRPGRVDVILVSPQPGVPVGELERSLRRAVGPANGVLRPDDVGASPLEVIVPFLLLIAFAAVGVSALLVYNTTSLSLAERRQDRAIVRALGAPGELVVVGALTEAGLVGVVGGAIGALLGTQVAAPIVGTLSEQVQRSVGAVLTVHVRPTTVVVGMLAGLAVGLVAAAGPARRALRSDLVADMNGRAAEQEPGRAGLAAPAAATAATVASIALCFAAQRNGGLSSWQPAVGQAAIVSTTVSAVVAVSLWTPIVIRLAVAGRRGAEVSGSVRIAILTLTRNPRRVTTIATAVAAAVALGAGLSSFLPASSAGIRDAFGSLADGRVYVSTLDISNSGGIDSRLTPGALDALRRIPGVRAVDPVHFVLTSPGRDEIPVSAVGGDAQPWRLLAGAGARASFARGDVMVGPGLARAYGLRPGSVLRLPTPAGGVVSLRVGGIWADPNSTGTHVSTSVEVFERLWGPQPVMGVFVRPHEGVAAGELAATIRAAAVQPGARVLTPSEYTDEITRETAELVTPFWALQRTLLLVTAIATVATLLLVGVQRRREYGILVALGLSPRGIRNLTLLEAGCIGLAASVLGVVAALALVSAQTQVAGVIFGLRPPFVFSVAAGAAYAAVGVAVTVAGALWPAWRISRIETVTALRYE